jgi:hypothetical protein
MSHRKVLLKKMYNIVYRYFDVRTRAPAMCLSVCLSRCNAGNSMQNWCRVTIKMRDQATKQIRYFIPFL